MMNSQELGVLAGLFAYPEERPDPEVFNLLTETGKEELVRAMDRTGLLGLQEEYVRLFINSLPEVPCPPYGSFYLEGTLMGRTTVEIRNLQQEYGLESDELADHVAVELEFLGLLIQIGKETAQVRQDQAFVLDHLRKWLPAFLQRVGKHDSTGFYKALSRCLQQIEF